MKNLRTYFDLTDGTASDIEGQLAARQERLRSRLASVRHSFAVMSGKGGVGKSVITANLAATLAADGAAVGVLDADLNGPSMARLLGADRSPLRVKRGSVEPALGSAGVRVMSMDLLLASEEAPVSWGGPQRESSLWRGTLEANALREFLSDTAWGELDYLILDLPPGTDRIVPVHDLLPDLGGVVVVTLPSDLSRFIVRKSLAAARELGIPIIGYVENMAGYICPHCGRRGPLFDSDGSGFESVPRLADVPFDWRFGSETDAGRPDVLGRPDSPGGRATREIAERVKSFFGE
jgi:ATP-binding protein involved in chromosome partitioning